MNKYKIRKNKNKGFSLIELLLYIALASVILIAVSYFIIMVLQARVKNQTINEVTSQGISAMQMIRQTIKNAESINNPAKGSSASSASIDVYTQANDPTVFDVSNGALRIKEGSADAINLTNARVTVSDLSFTNVSKTERLKSIKIQFTVTHINPANKNEYNYHETFYETINIK